MNCRHSLNGSEVKGMTTMNELQLFSSRPHIGKTGIFYDANQDEHFFVTLENYTSAQFGGIYQTCFQFQVACLGDEDAQLIVTMNHPDLVWNEIHPDCLPVLIDNSLVMNDREAFMQFTSLLLNWEENLAVCGGKVKGYNK